MVGGTRHAADASCKQRGAGVRDAVRLDPGLGGSADRGRRWGRCLISISCGAAPSASASLKRIFRMRWIRWRVRCAPGILLPPPWRSCSEECEQPVAAEMHQTAMEGNLGTSWEQALNNLAERMPLLEVSMFASAVQLQNRTGGKLNEVLATLAENMRESVALKGEVRALAAHGKLTGAVLTVLPIVICAIMAIVNPSYLGDSDSPSLRQVSDCRRGGLPGSGALRDSPDRGYQDMSGIWAGAGFFAFVLTAVAVAGYLLPAPQRAPRRGGSGRTAGGERQANSRSAVANLFQSIGENFPAAKNETKSLSHQTGRGRIPLAGGVADFLRHQVRQRVVLRRAAGNRGAGLPAATIAYAASDDLRTGTRLSAARSRTEFARARSCSAAAQRNPAGAGSDGAGDGSGPVAGSIHCRRQPRLEAQLSGLERGTRAALHGVENRRQPAPTRSAPWLRATKSRNCASYPIC